jgi:hypothetical protein
VQNIIKELEELYYSRKPVTVVTRERSYNNMAIISLTFARTRESGYARSIPIVFQEIRVTQAKTVTIPDYLGRGGATGVNAGTAVTRAASGGAGDSGGDSGDRGSTILGSLVKTVQNWWNK